MKQHPVFCILQGEGAGGAGLEVETQLPGQATGSDASDSEPAPGAYVLQRNGKQPRAGTAAALPWQQDSVDSSSEDEALEVMHDR